MAFVGLAGLTGIGIIAAETAVEGLVDIVLEDAVEGVVVETIEARASTDSFFSAYSTFNEGNLMPPPNSAWLNGILVGGTLAAGATLPFAENKTNMPKSTKKNSAALGTPGSMAVISLGSVGRGSKKVDGIGNIAKYIDIRSGTTLGNAGQQQFTDILAFGISTQWLTGVNPPTLWTSAIPYLNNDSNSLVKSTWLNSSENTTPIGQEMCLQKVDLYLTLTSAASIPVRFKLYYMTPKNGPHSYHPNSILSLAGNWAKNAPSVQVQIDPAAGTSSGGTNQPGYLSFDTIGMHPNQCDEFKKYWTIVETDDLMLNVGAEMDIKKTINMGQIGRRRDLIPLTGGVDISGAAPITRYYMKGTVLIMIVQYGGLVLDKTSGAPADGLPTTGSTKVMWMSRAVHHFQKIKPAYNLQEKTLQGNQNIPVNAAVGDQKDIGGTYTVQAVVIN